jgi:hypothetical protein
MKVIGSPSLKTSLSVCVTSIITIMIISSPILIFSNPLPLSAKSNDVDTSNLHSAFSLEDVAPSSPLASTSPTNVSPMDSDFTTQAALSLTRAAQTSNFVSSKAYYDISFRTATAGVIKHIEMAFPPGTYVGAAVLVEAVGIGPGTIAASGSTATGMTLTYTVTSEVNVPALTRIRIQVANVNNPPDAGASFTVGITTRNAANGVIDGPTPTSAYNMVQVSNAQIADGAITNSKIANGAIDEPQIAPNAIIPDVTGALQGDPVSVSPESAATAVASCPVEHPFVTGGGFDVESGSEAFMHAVASIPGPGGPNGQWTVTTYNSHPTESFAFVALVTCMAAMP